VIRVFFVDQLTQFVAGILFSFRRMDPQQTKQSLSFSKPENTTTIYDNVCVPFQKYVNALSVSPEGDRAILAG
jgi:hypothetical protein